MKDSIVKVLIVDDEERIRRLIRMFLEKEGIEVIEASNGLEAIEAVNTHSINIIVMDLMMPVMDGWEATKKIRGIKDVPIIMLTARGEEGDRILGFELGADDYVVKPFSTKELVMRVKALLRRSAGREERQRDNHLLKFPSLQIEEDSRRVLVEDREVTLTPLEFDLLVYMAKAPNRVFTREQLLQNVWGYDFFGDVRTVDTHIKRLREKLNKASTTVAEYIGTVWGVGYRFEVREQ